MYMLLNASLVINICSTVAWCRPYPRWYFTIFYFQCFPLAGLRLRFFWYVFPQDRQLLGCFFGRRFLIIPCSFFFCSVLADGSGYSFSLPVCSLDYPSPAQPSLFWPAILTPRYPVSGAPLPLRHVFFLTGYFDAQISGFRCLSPAPPRLFLTGYFAAQVSGFPVPLSRSATSFSDRLFWRPGIRFSVPFSRSATSSSDRLFGHPGIRFSGALLPLRHDSSDRLFWRPGLPFPVPQGLLFAPCFWCPWSSFSTPSFFFSHPTFPSRLLGWPARSLCRLAVRLRFLPLRFRRLFLGGLCSSAALMLAAPQSSPTSGRTLWCRLVHSVSGGPPFLTLFCTAWLTALGALLLISPVSLLCISYTLGDRRSSRLLGVGTRAPRVLPPPSWDLSAIGN